MSWSVGMHVDHADGINKFFNTLTQYTGHLTESQMKGFPTREDFSSSGFAVLILDLEIFISRIRGLGFISRFQYSHLMLALKRLAYTLGLSYFF